VFSIKNMVNFKCQLFQKEYSLIWNICQIELRMFCTFVFFRLRCVWNLISNAFPVIYIFLDVDHKDYLSPNMHFVSILLINLHNIQSVSSLR